MGVGAYASGPVVAEAAVRGIPAVAVEMDSHMGWTNRILSRLVDKVCLSFPRPDLDQRKYVYTGRPLRPALLAATREEGLARFGLDADRQVLLVFGGSLGAHTLNQAATGGFRPEGRPPSRSCTSPGSGSTRWWPSCSASEGANPDYQAFPFLDDFPLALAAADAVVGRAGGSVAEILARGVPSLLVPYPLAAGDHQTVNAKMVAAEGAALYVAGRRSGREHAGRGRRRPARPRDEPEDAGGRSAAGPPGRGRPHRRRRSRIGRRAQRRGAMTDPATETISIPAPEGLRSVHFIGIGGAGMSGIALVLHKRGYQRHRVRSQALALRRPFSRRRASR